MKTKTKHVVIISVLLIAALFLGVGVIIQTPQTLAQNSFRYLPPELEVEQTQIQQMTIETTSEAVKKNVLSDCDKQVIRYQEQARRHPDSEFYKWKVKMWQGQCIKEWQAEAN